MVKYIVWSDEEIYEFDDSWFLIANKAAANRILKEQHEESKTPITSDALSAESRYRLENRDGWRMQGTDEYEWLYDSI